MGCLNSKRKYKEDGASSSDEAGFANKGYEERPGTNAQGVGSSTSDTFGNTNTPHEEQDPKLKKGKKEKKKKQKITKNKKNKSKQDSANDASKVIVSDAYGAAHEKHEVVVPQPESLDTPNTEALVTKGITQYDQHQTRDEPLREKIATSVGENKKTEDKHQEQKLVDSIEKKNTGPADNAAKMQVLPKENDDLDRKNAKTQVEIENEQLHAQMEINQKEIKTKEDLLKEKENVLLEKDARIQDLQKKNDELTSANKQLNEEVKETHERYDKTLEKGKKNETIKALQWQLKTEKENMQAEKASFEKKKEKEIEELEKKKEKEIEELELKHGDLVRQRDVALAKVQNENKALKIKQNELLLRLSEMTGRRLTDNNPNIADLSDQNRPTKLAEKYAELYDNEWTETFTYLQTIEAFKDSEKDIIDILVKILFVAFTTATKNAEEKLETFRKSLNDFYGNSSRENGQIKDIMKQLKDHRKKITEPSKELKKEYQAAIFDQVKSLPKTTMESDTFMLYLQKCLEICWLMAIQDPPIFLTLENSKKGQAFDRNIFREYTKSGPFIDFIVWPAIFIEKDGALLCKGVVQCKKSNSFRLSGSHASVATDTRKVKSMYVKPTSVTSIPSNEVNERKTSSMITVTSAANEQKITQL